MDGVSHSPQPLPRGPLGLASLYLNPFSRLTSRCRTMIGGMRETGHYSAVIRTCWPSSPALEITCAKQGCGARPFANPFSCRIRHPTESAS